MRKMKDSGVGWIGKIPADWDMVNLSSIFGERKRKNVGLKERNLLSLSYGSVIKKDIDTSDGLLPVSFEGYNIIESGDIVLRLTDLQNDRRSLRTGLCKERGIITSAYCTLMKKMPEINSAYMQYYLHSFDICKGFYGMGAGVRQGLNFDGIRKLVMLFPNAETQAQICAYLDAQTAKIDEALFLNRAQIEELRLYKQSLIAETVTRGLAPDAPMKDSGVDWIGQIPTDWTVFPSKYMFHESVERRKPDDEQLTASQKYGIISQEEYMERENARVVMADKGLENWKHVEPNDFVISLRSFQGGLEMSKVKGCVTWHYIVLRAARELEPDYYKWLFKSQLYITALQRTCNYIRDGQDLRYSNFVAVPLCKPPLEEQKKIAAFLDGKISKIDALISLKQSKIEKLTRYRQSLIYEYVTGKKEAP